MNRNPLSHLTAGSSIFLPLLIWVAAIAAPAVSAAPVVTPLYSFTTPSLHDNLLVLGADKKFLYGCSDYSNGSENTSVVYRFAVGGAMKTLATFPNSFGFSDIINGANGDLILTEYLSNASSGGSILEVGLDGAVTTLASFSGANSGQPIYPTSLLLGRNGNYYGTSETGGVNDRGTIFEMSPGSPYTVTVLHSFGTGDGAFPTSLIQAADGSFYGTTRLDKNGRGYGLIFKVVSGYNIKVLHTTTGGSDGNPTGLMQATDGSIYGVTSGTRNYPGTIFTLGTDDQYSLVYTFSGADGAGPSRIIQSLRTGNLYGYTTLGGEYNGGTFYQFNPSAESITTLYSFNEPGPIDPDVMVLHPNGKFYGISGNSSANVDGTFFSLAVSGTTPALGD